jgi:hypothetical protein
MSMARDSGFEAVRGKETELSVLGPEQYRAAALAVCAEAQGMEDARDLLTMLGLLEVLRGEGDLPSIGQALRSTTRHNGAGYNGAQHNGHNGAGHNGAQP